MTVKRNQRDSQRQVRALREALDVYVSGRSGIRFEALVRFAGPIFDLYDVKWRSDSDVASVRRDRDELATMISVLDTARLLWTFFSLNEEKNIEMLPDLEDVLIGRTADDEERSNLLVLLSLLEEHWQTFSIEQRADAEDTPGYTLPTFESLLEEFRGETRQAPDSISETFGPDRLELPEAIALFAQPLLEGPEIEKNPDKLEEQIARAHAYWELALVSRDRFEVELARVLDSLASSEREREDIRRQATEMIHRFRLLFPDASPRTS